MTVCAFSSIFSDVTAIPDFSNYVGQRSVIGTDG